MKKQSLVLLFLTACLTTACDDSSNSGNSGDGGVSGPTPFATYTLDQFCDELEAAAERCGLNTGDSENGEESFDCRQSFGETFEQLLITPTDARPCFEDLLDNNMCGGLDEIGECLTQQSAPFQLVDGLIGMTCRKTVECCEPGEGIPMADDCDFFTGFLFGFLVNDIQNGLITFNAEAAAACVDALDQQVGQATCEELAMVSAPDPFSALAACPNVIVPNVDEGGICGTVMEDDESETGPEEPGEENDDGPTILVSNSACKSGLYCQAGGTLETTVCQPVLALGADCDSDDACGDEGFCKEGVCTAPGDNGEGCFDNAHCASGLCSDGTCSDTMNAGICDG